MYSKAYSSRCSDDLIIVIMAQNSYNSMVTVSGNAYDNPWKYMVTHSKKVFNASTHSETHQHQSQITKIVHTS